MRRFASFLLLGVALSAGAADIWRWKDADGVTHYSDQPVPGAERLKTAPSRPGQPGAQSMPEPPPPPPPPPAEIPYRSCAFVQPANDEAFFGVRSLGVSLDVDPPLQEGHHLRLYLDGKLHEAWPEDSRTGTLEELDRGSHSLELRVVDARGRTVCTSPVVRFHIQLPSVLSPARQPPKPPPKPGK